MRAIIHTLLALWLLSFPFYSYSIIGTLSFDNLLAPFLILLWPLAILSGALPFRGSYVRNLVALTLIASVYVAMHAIVLVTTQNLVWHIMYTALTDMIYLFIPILYVTNPETRKLTEDCIVVIAIIGCISAFLASIGVIHLEVSRFAVSRIGVEELQKAVGLFGAYGDMAMLISFAGMRALIRSDDHFLFGKRSRMKVALVFISILLGVIGSQSRNMVLTFGISILVFNLVDRWTRRGVRWAGKLFGLIIFSIVVIVVVIVGFWEPFVGMLSGWGGSKEAAGTVLTRLEQYRFGLSLFSEHPLLGAPPAIQEKMAQQIAYIHNMWLRELVQAGVVVVLIMIVFFIRGIVRLTRCLHVNRHDDAARLRVVLLMAIIVSSQFNVGGTIVFWTLLGLALAHVCAPREASGGNAGISKTTASVDTNVRGVTGRAGATTPRRL